MIGVPGLAACLLALAGTWVLPPQSGAAFRAVAAELAVKGRQVDVAVAADRAFVTVTSAAGDTARLELHHPPGPDGAAQSRYFAITGGSAPQRRELQVALDRLVAADPWQEVAPGANERSPLRVVALGLAVAAPPARGLAGMLVGMVLVAAAMLAVGRWR